MAALSTIAIVGLAVTAAGMGLSYQQQRRARSAQESAAEDQRRANATQSAQQASQAAQERRQQIREERIQRAQILNSAELTGAEGSSGEAGAVGGMATQLGANLGANTGSILAGQQITGFLQSAANNQTRAQTRMNRAGLFSQVGQAGGQMFASVGGWNTLFGPKPTGG